MSWYEVAMHRRLLLLLVASCAACASAYAPKPSTPSSRQGNRDPNAPMPPPTKPPLLGRNADLVSYRLPLRDNRVSPSEAFRCYSSCQPLRAPKAYLECLSACPGFEVNEGATCSKDDVPPVARCLTARRVASNEKVDPRLVVAVVGEFLLVVTLATLHPPEYLPRPPTQ